MDRMIATCLFLLLAANFLGPWTYIKASRKLSKLSWDDEYIRLERVILGCACLGGHFSIRIVAWFFPYKGLPGSYFQEGLRWSYYTTLLFIIALGLLVVWKLNLSSGGIGPTAWATFLITRGDLT